MKNLLLLLSSFLALSLTTVFADASKEKRFKQFDKDADGSISLEEYTQTRMKWNPNNTAEQSEKFHKYHDKDKDGGITLEEFLKSK